MHEEILSYFDESNIDPQNTVVRCKTYEEAETLLKYLVAKGVWEPQTTERLIARYAECGDGIPCYHISEAKWCRDVWYEKNSSCEIIDFCDIYIGDPLASQRVEGPLTISFEELMAGVQAGGSEHD